MSASSPTKLLAYLINLDRRPDRWTELQPKIDKLSFPIARFSAVDAINLRPENLRLPSAVAACWLSHQKIALNLLQNPAEHFLIMEDDVMLEETNIDSLNLLMQKDFSKIDLLQIGFCVHKNRLANRTRYNLQVKQVEILNFFHLLNSRLAKKYFYKLYRNEFVWLDQISGVVVKNDFQLGTHAYILKKFAEGILGFNNPVFLPADLAIMELVKTEKYAAFRLLCSVIEQSDSPSSISNASYNRLESELKLLEEANVF